MLYSLLLVLNVVSAIALVLLILLQRSETSVGGAFGGAASGTTVRNPLAKPTAWLAFIFMVSCLGTTLVGKGSGRSVSVTEQFDTSSFSETLENTTEAAKDVIPTTTPEAP